LRLPSLCLIDIPLRALGPMSASPRHLSLPKVITTNISVNTMARQLKRKSRMLEEIREVVCWRRQKK
jgi:hypothetical protein